MVNFELIRQQAREPGGAWGVHGDRDAAREFHIALRSHGFPRPLPKPVRVEAHRKGRGPRPWIARRDGEDLLDSLGRPRRFATKAAAVQAALAFQRYPTRVRKNESVR